MEFRIFVSNPFYRSLRKAPRMSKIALFLQDSGHYYTKSRTKFKISSGQVVCILISFNLSVKPSLYRKNSRSYQFLNFEKLPIPKCAGKRDQSIQLLNFSVWTNYDEILHLPSFLCMYNYISNKKISLTCYLSANFLVYRSFYTSRS